MARNTGNFKTALKTGNVLRNCCNGTEKKKTNNNRLEYIPALLLLPSR